MRVLCVQKMKWSIERFEKCNESSNVGDIAIDIICATWWAFAEDILSTDLFLLSFELGCCRMNSRDFMSVFVELNVTAINHTFTQILRSSNTRTQLYFYIMYSITGEKQKQKPVTRYFIRRDQIQIYSDSVCGEPYTSTHAHTTHTYEINCDCYPD